MAEDPESWKYDFKLARYVEYAVLVIKSWAAWVSGALIGSATLIFYLTRSLLTETQLHYAGLAYLAIVCFLGLYSQLGIWRREKEKNESLTIRSLDLHEDKLDLFCDKNDFFPELDFHVSGMKELGTFGVLVVQNSSSISIPQLNTEIIYPSGQRFYGFWLDVMRYNDSTIINDGSRYKNLPVGFEKHILVVAKMGRQGWSELPRPNDAFFANLREWSPLSQFIPITGKVTVRLRAEHFFQDYTFTLPVLEQGAIEPNAV